MHYQSPLAPSVAKGAALLDEKCFAWWNHVDADMLFSGPETDILAQVFTSENIGLGVVGVSGEESDQYGFRLSLTAYRYNPNAIRELRAAWKHQIMCRQNGLNPIAMEEEPAPVLASAEAKPTPAKPAAYGKTRPALHAVRDVASELAWLLGKIPPSHDIDPLVAQFRRLTIAATIGDWGQFRKASRKFAAILAKAVTPD